MTAGKQLTRREKLFCHYYVMLGNGREAALRAGYSAKAVDFAVARLLGRLEIQQEYSRIRQEQEGVTYDQALQGLWRLAFSHNNDAARLAFSEGLEPELISRLDLFGVSAIKKAENGNVEIKFTDRVKAMELLLKHIDGKDDKPGAAALYEALEQGAKALSDRQKDKDNEA